MLSTQDNQYALVKHWGIATDAIHLNRFSQRIPIDNRIGRGAFERYDFMNTSLSRVHCQFEKDQNLVNEHCTTAYSIHFSLQGCTHIHLNNSSTNNIIKDTKTIIRNAPSIWLVKGELGQYGTTINAGEDIKAFYIEIDESFISTLTKQLKNQDSFYNSVLAKLIHTKGYFSLPIDLNPQTEIVIKKAWQLFNTPSPTDELSFMALQGQTLTFTSEILMQSFNQLVSLCPQPMQAYGNPNHAYRAKILLDEYYHQNWTIRELAKKSGTNECYLKKHFKQLTKLTISEYRTQKRLQVARDLLIQGNRVATVASQTGFNSTDYFIKVFERFYSYHPTDVLHAIESDGFN